MYYYTTHPQNLITGPVMFSLYTHKRNKVPNFFLKIWKEREIGKRETGTNMNSHQQNSHNHELFRLT